jgi:nicotinamide-nucleotide amidase
MKQFEPLVVSLAQALHRRGALMVTAESCTGGMIAAACTAVAGSSDWFERGFVSYSNEAKVELLGVEPALLAAHGAVSAEVVRAMVLGALTQSRADFSVAVTGIAGPGGATPGKPVGTVWLACAERGFAPRVELLRLGGDRAAVREQTVHHALQCLLALLEPGGTGTNVSATG